VSERYCTLLGRVARRHSAIKPVPYVWSELNRGHGMRRPTPNKAGDEIGSTSSINMEIFISFYVTKMKISYKSGTIVRFRPEEAEPGHRL
jgi:hypothetical protein